MFENVVVPEPPTFNDDYSTRSDAAKEATMRIDRDLTKADVKKDPPPGLSEKELKSWKYQRYVRDYGLRYDVVTERTLHLPAYDGPLELPHVLP